MNLRSKRRSEDLTIDLMPLIDVVFLLLIFFLITTSFARPEESAIPINLPKGVSGQDVGKEEPVVIFVTEDGAVTFEGNEVPGEDLQERLQALKTERPDAPILLKGDTAASHGHVVETLDAIKEAGFNRVNLVIKKRD